MKAREMLKRNLKGRELWEERLNIIMLYVPKDWADIETVYSESPSTRQIYPFLV